MRIEQAIRRTLYGLLRIVLRRITGTTPTRLPLDTAKVRKILLLRYDRLGDMVVSTPLIQLLHERLPQAELHILASPRNVGLLHHDTRVHKTFVWNGTHSALPALAKSLRAERYDVMLCTVFFKMSYAGLLANLFGNADCQKITIAHDNPRRAELYAVWFNAQAPVEYITRQQTMAEMLVEFGCMTFGWHYEPSLVRFSICLSEAHRRKALSLLASLLPSAFSHPAGNNTNAMQHKRNRAFIFVNVSAGAPFREWSKERLRTFLEMMTTLEPNATLVINAIDQRYAEVRALLDESGTAPGSALSGASGGSLMLLPPVDDVLTLCAVIEQMDFVITPDTSITHFATACSKPTVVLCTALSSSPQWMPFGVPYRAVYAPSGAPVEAIEPASVLHAYTSLLDELHSSSK
jgi:ADP-heptose:LPS heptosyltransferase